MTAAPTGARRRPAAAFRHGSRRVPGRRVAVMRIVIAVVFVALAGRLVLVQLGGSGKYAALGAAEVTSTQPLPALRGGIYDRNGAVLAMSVPTSDVIADPFLIHDPPGEAARLAPLLGVPEPQLQMELSAHSGYAVLVRNLGMASAHKVMALHLAGITLQPDSQRTDPGGSVAMSLIGTVGAAGGGSSGLEYAYNRLLSGKPGSATVELSPSGVALPGSGGQVDGARQGMGLELTVDQPLQYVTEQSLGAEIAASHATSGIAVVMDVHTGAILSMANLVADPKTGAITQAASNLALTQVYEPGSVFKLVTFSAALQDGIITPDMPFTIPNSVVIDGSTFHDAESHPTERLTATQILAQSSNLGTIQIAQRLGATRLGAQIANLGFGRLTGLNLPGESQGIVLSPAKWQPTDIGATPIGQDDAVTAQQLLDMVNAVADGGTFVPPRLVRATVGSDGAVHALPRARTHRVIATWVTAQLTTMMEQVVQDGTAVAAGIPGYTVAGKTGTAQVPDPKHPGYIPGAFDATFAGFVPAERPQLSAVVVLDRPNPIYGGTTAAPVFAQIMRFALHRYGIPTSPGGGTTGGSPQAVPFPAPPSVAGTIAARAGTATGHP